MATTGVGVAAHHQTEKPLVGVLTAWWTGKGPPFTAVEAEEPSLLKVDQENVKETEQTIDRKNKDVAYYREDAPQQFLNFAARLSAMASALLANHKYCPPGLIMWIKLTSGLYRVKLRPFNQFTVSRDALTSNKNLTVNQPIANTI